jgi:hypothetical protein
VPAGAVVDVVELLPEHAANNAVNSNIANKVFANRFLLIIFFPPHDCKNIC